MSETCDECGNKDLNIGYAQSFKTGGLVTRSNTRFISRDLTRRGVWGAQRGAFFDDMYHRHRCFLIVFHQ